MNTITPYVIQGYGGTETTAYVLPVLALFLLPFLPPWLTFSLHSISVLCPPWQATPGIIGVPTPAVEVQLRDYEEAGYTVKNRDEHGRERPQGEICLRGPTIMRGYCAFAFLSRVQKDENWWEGRETVKQPDLTKEAIDEEGWCVSLPLVPSFRRRFVRFDTRRYLTGDIGQLNIVRQPCEPSRLPSFRRIRHRGG
jgi:acyl-CoA synthetase (AMP-forming)/AMP-acid ligase II